jgi:hypothetical protein
LATDLPQDLMPLILSIYPFRAPSVNLDIGYTFQEVLDLKFFPFLSFVDWVQVLGSSAILTNQTICLLTII